jgi:hypothetical protein
MQPVLIFMHVPKTGGVTLHNVIRRYHRPERTFEILGESVATVQDSVNRLRAMSETERSAITCIHGHVPFGIHRFLPRPARYLTIMRDPTARMVSDYYFARNTPNHALHTLVHEKNMSLADFIALREEHGLSNLCCRILSEKANWDELAASPRDATPDMLDTARRNIEEHFAVVGLTERFDESLLLIQDAFGWPDVRYERENVTRDKPKAMTVPADAVKSMQRYHGLDIELYEFARRRFEAQLAQAGAPFAARLARFHEDNLRYGRRRRMRRAIVDALPAPLAETLRRVRRAVA